MQRPQLALQHKKILSIENPSSAASSSPPLPPPPPPFQFRFYSVFSSLDGSIADGVTMVPSSEELSNVVGPSLSTKKLKWFKIKKWNAIAFWALNFSSNGVQIPSRRRERGSSSSSSSNSYFAKQALRAGFGIGSSGFIPPLMSRTEALLEELRRERIREELLAGEIAKKRMLEEDIRRELEIERLMAMRRLEEERFLLKAMEMEGRVGFGVSERLGTGFLLEDERSPPSLGMLPRFREDIGMDEMPMPPRFGDVGYLDKPHVRRKSIVGKKERMARMETEHPQYSRGVYEAVSKPYKYYDYMQAMEMNNKREIMEAGLRWQQHQ